MKKFGADKTKPEEYEVGTVCAGSHSRLGRTVTGRPLIGCMQPQSWPAGSALCAIVCATRHRPRGRVAASIQPLSPCSPPKPLPTRPPTPSPHPPTSPIQGDRSVEDLAKFITGAAPEKKADKAAAEETKKDEFYDGTGEAWAAAVRGMGCGGARQGLQQGNGLQRSL